ncbi:MAG: hypothetical protein COS34_04790 [Lysobacterales bacterium CG02_land_8_20_14_3_00_62_12]|nr:MAG: hypothetical protein COS34_04790 [Xanthomonadales bacterium CG02_land_8_20_14_3_00_62_12]
MSSNTIQVLLVSDQAAANLLPALDPALKPSAAILLVTGKMQQQAGHLAQVLGESGVKASQVMLPNEHDYGQLESALLDLASQHEGATVTLNVTGGTKLMALAAQSVARAAGWSIFYVDVDSDEVIWLAPEQRRQPLGQQLRLNHYLRGYGFGIEPLTSRPSSQPHKALLQTLILQQGSLTKAITQLNWLAQQSENNHRLDVPLSEDLRDSRSLEALLRNFEDAGVLEVKDDKVVFRSAENRDFAKGGWLEQYVFKTVCESRDALAMRDQASNLVVTDSAGVKNELDAVFLARNRLFVIECKTARMDQPEAPKANDTLFKLSEICRRVGGLGTRGMLASYRPLAAAEKRLAAALRIELVCEQQLASLSEKIQSWVQR